jgi:hypothetical protein
MRMTLPPIWLRGASLSPCESVCSGQSCANCSSHSAAAYQFHGGGRAGSELWCSHCLGLGSAPTASCLRGGVDNGGLRLTTHGGAGGRTLTYQFVCDPDASPSAGPEPGAGCHGPYGDPGAA